MLALALMAQGKDAFIAAMGGPTAPAGSATVQDLADVLEKLLAHLTTPGMRVYRPADNRQYFWAELNKTVE